MLEMKIDTHMHTPLCGHAVGEPVQYVQEAARCEVDLITFTCHIPMKHDGFGGAGVRMNHADLPRYFEVVDAARAEGEQLGVEVLCGIEAEIFPQDEVMTAMDQTLADYPFDFVLGSLHHFLPLYRKRLRSNGCESDFDRVESYFADLADGARSGRYNSISHPNVIRIYGTVQYFDPQEHEASIREFLTVTVEADVCMEVNTSGLIKEAYEVHPDPLILDWAAEMGVKLTIGSDAHRPDSVGQKFEEVIPMLAAKGFDCLHYHRKGERVAVAL